MPPSIRRNWPSFVLLGLAILPFWALCWGFPEVYEGDSPHHVNLAVYFGSGDLNPHVFKYPTFWSYILFAAYGLLYVGGRIGGAFRSVADFAALFIWKPWVFYLIARILTVSLGLGGIYVVMRTARRHFSEGAALVAGLILGFSWYLVRSMMYAKPDMLHFFFSALAWSFAFDLLRKGALRDYIRTGVALGWAASSHYGAMVLWPLLFVAHALRWRNHQRTLRQFALAPFLWMGAAGVLAAFLAVSPYIALDFPTFWQDFREAGAYAAGTVTGTTESGWRMTFATLLALGGWPVALAAAGGLLASLFTFPKGWLLWIPCAVYLVFLGSLSMTAGSLRFMYGMVPAMALLCALAWDKLRGIRGGRTASWALAAVLILPNAWGTFQQQKEMAFPMDTRELARDWIVTHIPAGSAFLLDQAHVSPNLVIDKKQAEELYRRTTQSGHARAAYYRFMLLSHPGGGYKIYRIKRLAKELGSFPRQTDLSQAGYAMLDVSEGLKTLRSSGIQYGVTSSEGASAGNTPRLSRFFKSLDQEAKLLKTFEPAPGQARGPTLKLYQLP